MKKWILQLFLFVIFAFICYMPLVYLTAKYGDKLKEKNVLSAIKYKTTNARFVEVKKVNPKNILFVGSSHTYRGFDTRIFDSAGYSSFNIGSSSQTPVQSMFLLNRYLKNIRPKIIILEVNPELLAADGVESELDIILSDEIGIDNIVAAGKSGNIKVINTLINRFFMASKINPMKNSDDTYISGGFVEKKLSFFSQKKVFERKDWKFEAKQIQALHEIRNICSLNKIKLICVYSPIVKTLYNSWQNNISFSKSMEQKGVFINANEYEGFHDSLHFYDELHLNQNGVIKFNSLLIKDLQNRRILN